MPTSVRNVMPRWVHAWAVLTVVTALPLVLLGAEVTTKGVGLVDPEGFRAPWHLLSQSLAERGLGYFIEHGHRLAGFVVGTCCIVLAALTLLAVRHPRARWLGCLALVMVSAQGVLGILRVDKVRVGPELALFHGLFAQLVLAVLVAVAVLTAPAWWRGSDADARPLRWPAGLLSLLVYAQIVFGAVIRHRQDRWAQRLHVLFAFAVVAALVWLVQAVRTQPKGTRGLRAALGVLCGLVLAQVTLGVEAWLRRFGAGVPPDTLPPSWTRDLIRSGHFVVGAALFAATVVLNLLLYRPPVSVAATEAAPFAPPPAAPVGSARLETVA
jgi:heme A synthase